MKNHKDNFSELHMEDTDADLIGAYNDAMNLMEVPDMWDKISAGFDAEVKNINLGNSDRSKHETETGMHHRRWLGLAAAILLLCIIAVPVIKSGVTRNDRKKTGSMDAGYEEEWSDEAVSAVYDSDSADMAVGYAESGGVAEYSDSLDSDSAEVTEASVDINDAAYSEGETVVSQEKITDDSVADIPQTVEEGVNSSWDEDDIVEYTVELSGSICRQGDKYVLTVSAVSESDEAECIISEGDQILLLGVSGKINLADGDELSSESIMLDKLTPLDENEDAKYQAELVQLR